MWTNRYGNANFTLSEPCIVIHIYMKKTNKMHLYLINLVQLNFHLHVSNQQVHHQEAVSVHAAYSTSHASKECLDANMTRL